MHYFKERLGFCQKDEHERIHVHAASVGEAITVLPLIEKIQLLNPTLKFLVSTNTPTGLAILKDRLQGNVNLTYLPIDFSGSTKRYFAKKKISNLWVVETEIWPWLFARANQLGIPITIINARLSHKSSGKIANFFKQTYSHALADVLVLARSREDAARYEHRGAHQKNISVVGNLKFATMEKSPTAKALLGRPYVLAASTHDDEELQLARAWLNSSADQLLVIAPRHAERGSGLFKSLNALQKTVRPDLPTIAVRSRAELPDDTCKLYLADTLGEMHHWYAYANAAFVGGSLVERGGHNVLEPCRTGTAIIVGAHTFNISEEVAFLLSTNAITIADNVNEVIQMLEHAVSDIHWAHSMGERAKAAFYAQRNVLDLYIASLINSVSNN